MHDHDSLLAISFIVFIMNPDLDINSMQIVKLKLATCYIKELAMAASVQHTLNGQTVDTVFRSRAYAIILKLASWMALSHTYMYAYWLTGQVPKYFWAWLHSVKHTTSFIRHIYTTIPFTAI